MKIKVKENDHFDMDKTNFHLHFELMGSLEKMPLPKESGKNAPSQERKILYLKLQPLDHTMLLSGKTPTHTHTPTPTITYKEESGLQTVI